MTNLEDIYTRLCKQEDKLMREKLLRRVNMGKRDWVKLFPNLPELDEVLSYFPKSYSITKIRSLGDFIYYLACNWNIVFPYKIKNLLR